MEGEQKHLPQHESVYILDKTFSRTLSESEFGNEHIVKIIFCKEELVHLEYLCMLLVFSKECEL